MLKKIHSKFTSKLSAVRIFFIKNYYASKIVTLSLYSFRVLAWFSEIIQKKVSHTKADLWTSARLALESES